MSDLREALSHIDAGHITLTSTAHLWALNEIYAAARRFLALTETGPDYEAAAREFYEGLTGLDDWDDEFLYEPRHAEAAIRHAKRIVDAALVDYLTEED